jgi:hypothetical protein
VRCLNARLAVSKAGYTLSNWDGDCGFHVPNIRRQSPKSKKTEKKN